MRSLFHGTFFRRRKFCRFTAEGVKEIDYKDLNTLKAYISETGKIVLAASPEPRHVISVSWPPLSSAPATALLPYTDSHGR